MAATGSSVRVHTVYTTARTGRRRFRGCLALARSCDAWHAQLRCHPNRQAVNTRAPVRFVCQGLINAVSMQDVPEREEWRELLTMPSWCACRLRVRSKLSVAAASGNDQNVHTRLSCQPSCLEAATVCARRKQAQAARDVALRQAVQGSGSIPAEFGCSGPKFDCRVCRPRSSQCESVSCAGPNARSTDSAGVRGTLPSKPSLKRPRSRYTGTIHLRNLRVDDLIAKPQFAPAALNPRRSTCRSRPGLR